MADETKSGEKGKGPEPRGFGEHTRGLSGEYAHEQGWGLDEEERTRTASGPQDTDGGTDYEYGAQDFGDEPVNAARVNSDVADKKSAEPPGKKKPQKLDALDELRQIN